MNPIMIIMVVLAVILIAAILMQQKSSSLGSMAGQDAGEEMAQTRRGPEKFLHQLTVFLVILFVMGGLYSMFFGEKITRTPFEITTSSPEITINEGEDTEIVVTPEETSEETKAETPEESLEKDLGNPTATEN